MEQYEEIIDGVGRICRSFDAEYWLARDNDQQFPHEFHGAIANGGWLGLTMPEEYGGAGLGILPAGLMMHEVARSGGGMAAASALHVNMFGPHPVVVHGSDKQKADWLPDLAAGKTKVCFGVTEPDSGLDTTRLKTVGKRVDGGYLVSGRKIWTSTAQVADKILLLARTTPLEDCKKPTEGLSIFYTDLDRSAIEVKRIAKHGRAAVDSNMTFFDDFFVPDQDLIGDEGSGFRYLLDGLNPERILIGMEALGIGAYCLETGAQYANERHVFGRTIGKNQSIQHPLAESWAELEAARLLALKAAELYDAGLPCGSYANAAKLLGGRAGHEAALRAVMTHGGMGYAREYHVERMLREVLITRLAPVSEQLILSFIAEKELGLEKSY